jgi:predicted nucleic acid-binding protein
LSTSRACKTIPPSIWGGGGLLGAIYPYFLTYAIMERYAEIRRTLRPPHGPGLIGDIDTLIAATALERNLTVVTTDSDYERVPDLKVRRISLKRV